MTRASEASDHAVASTGLTRLAVGLVQGLLLYGLHHASDLKAWPATDKTLFAAFTLAVAFAPLVLHAGLGHLRRTTLAIWFAAAAAVCAIFAAWQAAGVLPGDADPGPFDVSAAFAAAAFLFIAHHLIVPADRIRKLVAPYPAYFDRAWLDGVQLGLAMAFTGAFWLGLHLGAALFALIGLKDFETFIDHDWFFIPATTLMFAVGVHLADVRVGLTRGLRTVGLILLSWLLPLMGLIAVAFLLSLPFTGLAILWKAGAATGMLLGAMAGLIVLINAAFQDGEHAAPMVLKWAGRATALALVPLAAIDAYGLSLRVGEHGLTPQRIRIAACIVVAGCYAIGYAYSAVRPGRWMRRLEATNIAVAPLVLILIFALYTPIADPARISVADQVARLKSGRTPIDKFDFAFLRFHSGKMGLAALRGLARDTTSANAGAIRPAATDALKHADPYQTYIGLRPLKISVYPAGAALPTGFTAFLDEDDLHDCRAQGCEAYLVDLGATGEPDIVVRDERSLFVVYAPDGAPPKTWRMVGSLVVGGSCDDMLTAALRSGQTKPVPRFGYDLMAGGQRFRFASNEVDPKCPSPPKPNTPSPAPPPSGAR